MLPETDDYCFKPNSECKGCLSYAASIFRPVMLILRESLYLQSDGGGGGGGGEKESEPSNKDLDLGFPEDDDDVQPEGSKSCR